MSWDWEPQSALNWQWAPCMKVTVNTVPSIKPKVESYHKHWLLLPCLKAFKFFTTGCRCIIFGHNFCPPLASVKHVRACLESRAFCVLPVHWSCLDNIHLRDIYSRVLQKVRVVRTFMCMVYVHMLCVCWGNGTAPTAVIMCTTIKSNAVRTVHA